VQDSLTYYLLPCMYLLQVSITTEVPAFTLQGAVLQRVSPEALLNLALAATALRLALYGLLPLAGNPWAVLPVELLHGVTFGLGWGAATASSTWLAQAHLSATMQVSALVFKVLVYGRGIQGLQRQ
jgi:hypothetical protein